jgi:hypothetical protein
VETEDKESDIQSVADSVDSYQSSTIMVDITSKTQQAGPQHGLFTPEDTPALPQALPQAPPQAPP